MRPGHHEATDLRPQAENGMSRFSIDPPDDDAYTPRVLCVTPHCDEYVDCPEREVYCYACRVKHRLQEAAVAEYLAQEDVVMDQPEKFGVAHVRRRQ
jgi:hypothetical protein